MKLFDLTLWATVLLLAGAIALTPRHRAAAPATGDPENLLVQAAAPGADAVPEAVPGAVPGAGASRERHIRVLDAQTVRRCLEVMRDIDPARAAALERVRAQQSEKALAEALSDKRYLLSLASLKDQDPGLYQMRIDELRLDGGIDQLLTVLIEARRVPGKPTKDLEEQLHGMVMQKVAFSLASRGKYLIRLREQVEALQDELSHDAQPASFLPAVERKYREMLDQIDAGAARAPRGQ